MLIVSVYRHFLHSFLSTHPLFSSLFPLPLHVTFWVVQLYQFPNPSQFEILLVYSLVTYKVEADLPGSGACIFLVAQQFVSVVRFISHHCHHICFVRSVCLYILFLVYSFFFLSFLYDKVPNQIILLKLNILTLLHGLIN